MASEKIQLFLSIGIVVFSVLAGVAWLRAATARVRAPDELGFRMALGDDDSYEVIADGIDVGRTLALQSRWNTAAAAFACAAAFFQALQANPITKLLG
jgi:hypothetical protein